MGRIILSFSPKTFLEIPLFKAISNFLGLASMGLSHGILAPTTGLANPTHPLVASEFIEYVWSLVLHSFRSFLAPPDLAPGEPVFANTTSQIPFPDTRQHFCGGIWSLLLAQCPLVPEHNGPNSSSTIRPSPNTGNDLESP